MKKDVKELKKLAEEINKLSRQRARIQKDLTEKLIQAIQTKLGYKCERWTPHTILVKISDASRIMFSVGTTGKLNFAGGGGLSGDQVEVVLRDIKELLH